MKRRTYLALLALVALVPLSSKAESERRFVYLSAGGQITVYEADPESGKLTQVQQQPGAGLTAITRDQKFLYRVGGGEIEAFQIESDGQIFSLGKGPSGGKAGYLSLDATERYLAGSNYGGGSVAIWAIDPASRFPKWGVAKEVTLEKAAHSAVFDPTNRFLLVPATTPNKVFQLAFDAEQGTLEPHRTPSVSGPTKPGSAQQPRHLVFHPNGKIAYTTLERELPGVGVWRWDSEAGLLTPIQDVVTLPPKFEGAITTADLHLTPDARFLYVSNRDLTDRKALTGDSSIVGFRVDPDSGRLELIGHTPCPQIPRGFVIDHAGDFLYAAGQVAAKLAVYRINRQTGALEPVEVLDTPPGPNWVRCVTRPAPAGN